MKILGIIWMVFVALSSAALAQSGIDTCEAIFPETLKAALKIQYPAYRVVRVSDYNARTIKELRGSDPTKACLAVASADIDGDGFRDIGFFLTDLSGQTVLLAARHFKGRSWQISKLMDFPKGELGSSYVEVIEPGSYEDMYADTPDYEEEAGRLELFKSNTSGFLAGTIDSSGVAFFFSGTQWVHLWLSD